MSGIYRGRRQNATGKKMLIIPFKVHRVYHCPEFIAPAPSQEEMPLFVKAL